MMDTTHFDSPERTRGRLALLGQAHIRFCLHRQFLVICAACQRIRDDIGRWHEIEVRSNGSLPDQLSHGLCPDCVQRLYPEDGEDAIDV